jgi:PAS domain S-box-containing protein
MSNLESQIRDLFHQQNLDFKPELIKDIMNLMSSYCQDQNNVQEKDEFFNTLNQLPDATFIFNLESQQIEFANKEAVMLYGYSYDEMIGKTPDLIDKSEGYLKGQDLFIKQKNKKFEFETIHTTKSGKTIPVEVYGGFITMGNKRYFLTSCRNIAKTKELQTILKNKEEYFRSFYESSPDAILLANLKTGIIIDVNKAAVDLFEMERDQLVGMNQSELHPDELSTIAKDAFSYKAYNQNEKAPALQIEIITSRQKRKYVEITGDLLKLDGEEFVLGHFREITDRKKAEQALKESEERFRLLFENTTSLILEVDAETFEIICCNPAMAKNFGTVPENLIGKDIRKLLPPEVMAKRIAFGEKAFEENKAQSFEDERIGRYFRNNFIPIISNGRKFIQTVSYDITENKKNRTEPENKRRKVQKSTENRECRELGIRH